jgi:predicted RecA/RadA family phage recombinase
MTNYVQEGKIIDFANTSGSAIASGDVVLQGEIIGVAVTNIAATTGTGAVAIKGVFKLPLAGSLAITAGDAVFWNAGTKTVTKTNTDSQLGFATTSQNSNDPFVNVLLNPTGSGTTAIAADVAAVATANAVDLATAEALANQLKTTVNAILTSLKTAGIMA